MVTWTWSRYHAVHTPFTCWSLQKSLRLVQTIFTARTEAWICSTQGTMLTTLCNYQLLSPYAYIIKIFFGGIQAYCHNAVSPNTASHPITLEPSTTLPWKLQISQIIYLLKFTKVRGNHIWTVSQKSSRSLFMLMWTL
jgi:hypothetical protein